MELTSGPDFLFVKATIHNMIGKCIIQSFTFNAIAKTNSFPQ